MKTSTLKQKYIGAFSLIIVVVVFFISEFITSLGWVNPSYSYISNWISDLGVPIITSTINSPFYILINFVFVLYGVLISLAYTLISKFLSKNKMGKISLVLLILHGIGAIFVGFFPGYEWEWGFLHSFGAILVFYCGNLGIILLGRSLKRNNKTLSILGVILGSIGIISSFAMFAFSTSNFGALLERMTLYPILIWNLIFGVQLLFNNNFLVINEEE